MRVNIASAAPLGSWAAMRPYTRRWPRLEATHMARSDQPMYRAVLTTWLSSARTTPTGDAVSRRLHDDVMEGDPARRARPVKGIRA
jgi:hypothetical protein